MVKFQKSQILALFQSVLLTGILSMSGLFPRVTSATQPLEIIIAQQRNALTQTTTEARAEQAYWKGIELRNQGTADSLQQAIAQFTEAISLYREVANRVQEAEVLGFLAFVFSSDLKQYQEALNYYFQAMESYLRSLTLWRKTENQAKEASTLYQMAALEQGMGNLEAARRWIAEALQVLQEFCGNGERSQEYPCDAVTLQDFEQLHQELFRQSN